MKIINWQEILIEHNDLFVALLDSGILDMRNGSITMHYDKDGALRKIDRLQTTFKN